MVFVVAFSSPLVLSSSLFEIINCPVSSVAELLVGVVLRDPAEVLKIEMFAAFLVFDLLHLLFESGSDFVTD